MVKKVSKVFFIMPFGKKKYIRARTFQSTVLDHDKHYKDLKERIEKLGSFEVYRNDDSVLNNAYDSMFLRIKKADIVFVDLSFYNANVVYELGLRHAGKEKSTILFRTECKSNIPFNVQPNNIRGYEDLLKPENLKSLLDSEAQISTPLRTIKWARYPEEEIWRQLTKGTSKSQRLTEIVYLGKALNL